MKETRCPSTNITLRTRRQNAEALEAIPLQARRFCPGYEQVMSTATVEREAEVRRRKETTPWHGRCQAAQRKANQLSKAMYTCNKDFAHFEDQLKNVQEQKAGTASRKQQLTSLLDEAPAQVAALRAQ